MKFDKVTPKVNWPAQKVYQRIAQVSKDIASFNRAMNSVDGEQRRLVELKKTLRRKVSDKWKYHRQLKEQLKECKHISAQISTSDILT